MRERTPRELTNEEVIFIDYLMDGLMLKTIAWRMGKDTPAMKRMLYKLRRDFTGRNRVDLLIKVGALVPGPHWKKLG